MKKFPSCQLLILILLSACGQPANRNNKEEQAPDHEIYKNYPLKPEMEDPVNTVRLSNDLIEALFADNSRYGAEHRAGYNGIAELRHKLQDSSVFVPYYAGFNLEHIFGGDSLPELFEPRLHPMELYRVSDNQVILYQTPTPLSHVESKITFTLVPPHYIDVKVQFIIHEEEFFRHGYAGLFWASYIHAPSDKFMYFKGRRKNADSVKWIKTYSEKHGEKSTHLYEGHYKGIYFADNFNARLASNFSDYLYRDPFFFGRFHNMALIFMFDRMEGIRFSQSPTGGGPSSPAWDFQVIVPDFVTGKEYNFNARIVYKLYEGMDDVYKEYTSWINQ